MKSLRAVFLLLALIVISIAIRWYHLDDQVDYFNPCQMITLTTLEIWRAEGISKCHFSPIETFSNAGDKFNTPYKRVEDEQGNNYYVSYPPFAFLFAHAFFSVTRVYPSQFHLQAINLLLHFLSALFLYLIVCHHYSKSWRSLFFPALVCFTAYLFLPVVLYAHTRIFFPDMMANMLWAVGIYSALKVFQTQDSRHLFALGAIIFLGVYSEWICLLFAFSIGIAAWLFRKEMPAWKRIVVVVAITASAALALTAIQYSSINGLEAFLKSLKGRFAERSGFLGEEYSGKDANSYSISAWLAVVKSFHSSFYALGYFSIALFVSALLIGKPTILKLSNHTKILLLLSFAPALLHLFLLFNFNSIHHHAFAKFGIPLCIAIGLLTRIVHSSLSSFSFAAFILAFISALGLSAIYFRASNPHRLNHPYLTKAAEIIQNEAEKDETILVKIESDSPNPFFYVSYMAKRNVVPVNSAENAEALLRKQSKRKGVIFFIDERKASYTVERLILE